VIRDAVPHNRFNRELPDGRMPFRNAVKEFAIAQSPFDIFLA
jgi:hypothetical protein